MAAIRLSFLPFLYTKNMKHKHRGNFFNVRGVEIGDRMLDTD